MNLHILRFSLTILLLSCLFGCKNVQEVPQNPDPGPKVPPSTATTTYLALGDSYTIGESVRTDQRWPVRLAAVLNLDSSISIADPKIIARTGWTTDELGAAIVQQDPPSDYDIVSLLIGVNNQYRGYPFKQYEDEFVELLNTAVIKAKGRSDKVFVVSIPDYGITPFAENQGLDPQKIGSELDAYNNYAKEICAQRGIAFFDITPISREAVNDGSLVATDGLHPSAKMYAQWVNLMQGRVKEMVQKE